MKHKESFIKHYCDKHLHLNTLVTSRVESNHALLKRHLHKGKRASIDEVIHGCAEHIQHQYGLVQLRDRIDTSKTPVWLINDNVYEKVRGKISSSALELIRTKVDEAKVAFTSGSELSRPCSGIFNKTMGLPCEHVCLHALRTHGHLPADLFLPRWRLGMLDDSIQAIGSLYPMAPILTHKTSKTTRTVAARGRKRASTGRILSAFEREDFADTN